MRKLILASLLVAPAAAFAGGYIIPNENARSLGLAEADVADQTGPEAAYKNAAALAGQEGFAITGGDEFLYNRTYWTDPGLGSATLQPHANFPPFAAVSWGQKLNQDMAYGLGVAFLVPAGGAIIWPENWVGDTRIQSVDQKVYLTQFSGGFQPIQGVKIGASFLWYRATEDLTQKLVFGDTVGTAELGLAGNAYSFGLSGEFKIPTLPLTLGIDYRHQAALTLNGAAHFSNVPPTFASQLQDQSASEAVTIPNELFLGLAYDVPMAKENGELKILGTFSFERWIVYKSDTYVGSKGLVITVPRDYNNAHVFRFSGEWTHVPLCRALTLRLGFERSISEQPSTTVSPTLTDGDSTILTAGAGYDILPNLRFDLGYQLVVFDWVNASGVEAFPGSYKTHVNILGAGLTFRM